MTSRSGIRPKTKSQITKADLEMVFPEPDKPLLQGSGEPCTWAECMEQTATMTNFWLKHYGPDEVLPPPWEERFTLD